MGISTNEEDVRRLILSSELLPENEAIKCIAQRSDAEEVVRRAIDCAKRRGEWLLTHSIVDEVLSAIATERKAVEVVAEPKAGFDAPARKLKALVEVREFAEKKTEGKLEDFVAYFRDRYSRVSELLRGRISETALTTIAALKETAQGDRELKRVIGIVFDKKETKNGHVLFEIEDSSSAGTLKCLAPKNSAVRATANSLLLDEVVAVDGFLSGGLFIANDIVWPETPIRKRRTTNEDVSIAFISDLHVGSKYFLHEQFQRFLRFLNGEGSDEERELAGTIKYVSVAGDCCDGIGVYPGQEKQLVTKDIFMQYEIFAEFMKNIPEWIEVIIAPGNHDAVHAAEPQPPLPKEFVKELADKPNVHLVSNPASVNIHGFRLLIYHGASMHGIFSSIPGLGSADQNPENAAKKMLTSRLLNPIYGDEPRVVGERDALVIDEVPDFFHLGESHKTSCADYNGTMIINSGTWQDKTDYQIRLGHAPTPCLVPLYNLRSGQLKILNFEKEKIIF
ncbi:MAG: metallophosphoesterase [Candidatus Norongarragalinales archaeon]